MNYTHKIETETAFFPKTDGNRNFVFLAPYERQQARFTVAA